MDPINHTLSDLFHTNLQLDNSEQTSSRCTTGQYQLSGHAAYSTPAEFDKWCSEHPDYKLIDGDMNSGETILIKAASTGNLDLVKHLAKNKALLNMQDRDFGVTALDAAGIAIENGYECAKVLLESGADPNICRDGFDITQLIEGKSPYWDTQRENKFVGLGDRPLYWAAKEQKSQLVELLVQYGALYHSGGAGYASGEEPKIVRDARFKIGWPKGRLLWIGHKDAESVFCQLPTEVITLFSEN